MSSSAVWQEHCLTKGELTLVLLPEIGGRLIDIRFQGESLLFTNPDLVLIDPDPDDLTGLPSRAEHIPFPLWGGEKTWVSPESSWPGGAPYPALDSGAYRLEKINHDSVRMTSQVCPISGLQIIRTISFCPTQVAAWTIHHAVRNCGQHKRYCGIWSVMMVRRPVAMFYLQNTDKSIKTIFGDPAGCIKGDAENSVINCNHAQEFKIGDHPRQPHACAVFPNGEESLLLNSTVPTLDVSEAYSHGHALEVYNSGHYEYAELEWHSPAVQLAPSESIGMDVRFELRGSTVRQQSGCPDDLF